MDRNSYFEKTRDELKDFCSEKNISMRQFFQMNGVPSSSFYERRISAIDLVNSIINEDSNKKQLLQEDLDEENDEEVIVNENEKKGKEEIKAKKKEIYKDLYRVYYNHGKKHVDIHQKTLDLMIRDYTTKKYTINRMAVKYNLTREEYFAIKSAFSFTHDSPPFSDKEFEENSVDTLVEKSLNMKKREFFRRQEKENIKRLKKENDEYKKIEYWHDKIFKDSGKINVSVLNLDDSNILIENCFKNEKIDEGTVFLPIADPHSGLKIDNYFGIYDFDEQKRRFHILTEKVLFNYHNNDKIVVGLLGDLVHGIIHESARIQAENIVDSIRNITENLIEMIMTFCQNFEEVEVMSVVGNHDSVMREATTRTDRDNFSQLIMWIVEREVSEKYDNFFVLSQISPSLCVSSIGDAKIAITHGNAGGNLRHKIDKGISGIDYVFSGHFHEEEMKNKWYKESSFSGINHYSMKKLFFSEPKTNIYVIEGGKIRNISPVYYQV